MSGTYQTPIRCHLYTFRPLSVLGETTILRACLGAKMPPYFIPFVIVERTHLCEILRSTEQAYLILIL